MTEPAEHWDNEQTRVIQSPPDARLVVEAGPGNGKTAVACARIAHLINECGVEAVNVMLISFTRTAVAELRSRIAAYLGNEATAAAIRIATLDSTSWAMLNGFDSASEALNSSYEQNIARFCGQLQQRNEDLLEHLAKYEHIVVDEAQDILGLRAELVELLLAHTSPACGVTVLADSCQAIYGFTTENGDDGQPAGASLIERLKRLEQAGKFQRHQLTRLYRTSDRALVRLLKKMRPLVESAATRAPEKHQKLRELITGTVPQLTIMRQDLAASVAGRDDLLVLYRTRAEALLSSSMLCSSGVRHRLRISGLPVWLKPWIGAILGDWTQPVLERQNFELLWKSRNCESLPGSPAADKAWNDCLRVAGQAGKLKLDRLRGVLSRSRPPVEFTMDDNGFDGPTIGTIHASKGREANEVFLFLPPEPEQEDFPWEEETRVLYVGATRAKRSIRVGTTGSRHCSILPKSGRPFRSLHHDRAIQFEVGRDGDLDPISLVSSQLHNDAEAASVQRHLLQFNGEPISCLAESTIASQWRYRLRHPAFGEQQFAEFSQGFSREAFSIAKKAHGNSPRKIPHIWQVGVRTIVLPPDSPSLTGLAKPYGTTGIFLAPVLRGWTKAFLGGSRYAN